MEEFEMENPHESPEESVIRSLGRIGLGGVAGVIVGDVGLGLINLIGIHTTGMENAIVIGVTSFLGATINEARHYFGPKV
jgi:hypothetical protein